jgi:hypothetical protein
VIRQTLNLLREVFLRGVWHQIVFLRNQSVVKKTAPPADRM